MALVSTALSLSTERPSALPVRVLAGLLTTLVMVAAASAVVEAVRLAPVAGPDVPPTVEPTDPVAAADAVAAADLVVTAGADVDPVPRSFTLDELARGEVTPAAFAAFWEAELERIRTAPCQAAPSAGSMVVTIFVGATPPAHLGDAYPDYAPVLATARAEAASACD